MVGNQPKWPATILPAHQGHQRRPFWQLAIFWVARQWVQIDS